MRSGVRWVTTLGAFGTLAALSGGCGKVTSSNGGDDAGSNAGSDAGGNVDANLTPVTVTVLTSTGDGVVDATAKVVFQDPDGTVVADVMVDAQGKAQSPLPRGGSVTAIRTLTSTTTAVTAEVTTITEVAPGDALTFGVAASPGQPQGGQTTMSLSFPLASGATTYSFSTPCGTTPTAASPVTLTFRDSCHGTTFDLLGTTRDGNNTPMYARLAGVTYQANVAFQIPAPGFIPMPVFTVHANSVPTEVSSMSVTRASLAGDRSVSSNTMTVPGKPTGNVSIDIPFPAGFGTRSELVVIMGRDDAQVAQEIHVHTATLGTGADVDVSKQPLPWLTNVAQTATGATWTQVAPGDGTGAALLVWAGQWMAGGKTVMVTRRLAQPVSTTAISMALPRLPASYAAVDPEQQTVPVTPSGATVFMGNYDVRSGYGQIRTMPETLLTTSAGNLGALLGQPFQRRIVVAKTP